MKEEDIRPSDLFEEYRRLSAHDAETCFVGAARLDVPCPGCGNETSVQCFVKLGFPFVQCAHCATLYQSPRPTLEAFSQFYSDSESSRYWAEVFFPAVKEARRQRVFRPRVDMLSQLCGDRGLSPGIVMEVGAGHGVFLEEWRRRHPQAMVAAVEPNAAMAQICRENGIEVLQAMAEGAEAWHGRADLLVCFEVLEHVHDTVGFAQSLLNLIKPGGWLAMSGLGVEGFDIQVLWERSHSVSPPHHLNFLSCQGLEVLLRRVGFTAIDVTTPGQLDADIVYNSIRSDPTALAAYRFENTLLSRGERARVAFQQFLREHRLSSHMLAIAQRGE